MEDHTPRRRAAQPQVPHLVILVQTRIIGEQGFTASLLESLLCPVMADLSVHAVNKVQRRQLTVHLHLQRSSTRKRDSRLQADGAGTDPPGSGRTDETAVFLGFRVQRSVLATLFAALHSTTSSLNEMVDEGAPPLATHAPISHWTSVAAPLSCVRV